MTNRYSLGWCGNCGKVAYATRPLAKAAAKAFHPSEHMSVYRCPWIEGCHHLGHLPDFVIRGKLNRSEIRNRPGWYR